MSYSYFPDVYLVLCLLNNAILIRRVFGSILALMEDSVHVLKCR